MEILVSKFNPHLSFGLGVFETLPYLSGKIPFLNEHIERLQKGLLLINGSKIEITSESILTNAQRELAANTGVIRIIARVDNTLELHISEGLPYTIQDYEKGFSLTIAGSRKNEFSPYLAIKSLNYLENHVERIKAKEAGFNDALFLNTSGKVAETSSANIFTLHNNVLSTPPVTDGILPGIIRAKVIEFALAQGYAVAEKSFEISDVLKADHVFLTNSLLCIMPVSQIDGQSFNRASQFEEQLCNKFMLTYYE